MRTLSGSRVGSGLQKNGPRVCDSQRSQLVSGRPELAMSLGYSEVLRLTEPRSGEKEPRVCDSQRPRLVSERPELAMSVRGSEVLRLTRSSQQPCYEGQAEPRSGFGLAHRAFTLIELLVVIAVAGILAALAVPAIKEFGRSNVQLAATRQMLDAVGRARQLAIANRTTVYMVFLPNGFLTQSAYNYLPQVDKNQALRLAPDQGRAYALVSLRSIGDQPGQARPQYLSEWKTLPQGWIFAPSKFDVQLVNYSVGTTTFPVQWFESTTDDKANPIRLPFPSADAPLPPRGAEWILPYIAFDYQGQLVSRRDEFIPLARGAVDPALDANQKYTVGIANVTESPPGNSLDVVNLIHIDWLTGRARLEERKVE